MYNSKQLAENIRFELEKKNISQKDFLEKCELGVNTIRKLSTGTDIVVKSLVKIADSLNCSTYFLLGRESSLPINKKFISADPLFLDKLLSLPADDQNEIIHMTNYKYEQYQKKKRQLSSGSKTTEADEAYDMLA